MCLCERKDCPGWPPPEGEEECGDCVDGRDIQVVSGYASTCDGCAELTHHEEMAMDEKTQLGYCPECARERGMKFLSPEEIHALLEE